MKIKLYHTKPETASDSERWQAHFIDVDKYIISELTQDQYAAYEFFQSQLEKEKYKRLNSIFLAQYFRDENKKLQSQLKKERSDILKITNKNIPCFLRINKIRNIVKLKTNQL